MKKLNPFFFGCLFLLACQSNGRKEGKSPDSVPYPNGSYCAEADYFNPTTRYKTVYRVSVDIKSMAVYLVHFSGGRVIGEPSFRPTQVVNGKAELVTDLGVQFRIRDIRSESGCYIDPQPEDLFQKAAVVVQEPRVQIMTVPAFVVLYVEGSTTEVVTPTYQRDPEPGPVVETGVIPAPVESPTYFPDPKLSTLPLRRGELVSMEVALDLPQKQPSDASRFDIDQRLRTFRRTVEFTGKPGKTVMIKESGSELFFDKAKADSFYAKVTRPITKEEVLKSMGINTDFLKD